jgi:hypothetical protein
VREIVIARHGEDGWSERAQQLGGPVELSAATPVGKIAGSHDELGLEPLDEARESAFDLRLLVCTGVQIGNMEEPCVHNRTRL